MELNNDFLDFFKALNDNDVEYIVVGGYAVGFYGYYRYTSDLDIFVNPVINNIDKLFKAFNQFGASTNDLNKRVFLQKANKRKSLPWSFFWKRANKVGGYFSN